MATGVKIMKINRSVVFDREERDEMIVEIAKAKALELLGKLNDDEELVVCVESWGEIKVTVDKKPEPDQTQADQPTP